MRLAVVLRLRSASGEPATAPVERSVAVRAVRDQLGGGGERVAPGRQALDGQGGALEPTELRQDAGAGGRARGRLCLRSLRGTQVAEIGLDGLRDRQWPLTGDAGSSEPFLSIPGPGERLRLVEGQDRDAVGLAQVVGRAETVGYIQRAAGSPVKARTIASMTRPWLARGTGST
jgi:hypothetical protein